ncbi:hypothetical protein BDV18DRAFT_120266 [Aspergillus unguis]
MKPIPRRQDRRTSDHRWHRGARDASNQQPTASGCLNRKVQSHPAALDRPVQATSPKSTLPTLVTREHFPRPARSKAQVPTHLTLDANQTRFSGRSSQRGPKSPSAWERDGGTGFNADDLGEIMRFNQMAGHCEGDAGCISNSSSSFGFWL